MKKIVLTTALVLATASAAMAFDFDPNLANRYPAYAASHAQAPAFTSRNVALGGGQWSVSQPQAFDRASNPSAGGSVR